MKHSIKDIKNKLITLQMTARQLREGAAQLELKCSSLVQDLDSLQTPGPPLGGQMPMKAARALLKKASKIVTIEA